MKRLIHFALMNIWVSCLFFNINNAWALTPEQVIALKNAGVSDQTIQLMIRQEQEAELMNLISQLPLPQRAVLLLHFVEDFSLEEIARITETPLGTVKSRLHYAKCALRKLLEEKT